MKTNHQARQVLKLRVWASTVAVLVLASAEFWMVCHVGHDCGQMTAQPVVQVPAIADWFAAR
jgi:diadenosine tetraphosphatase ApaH/serine/threonine PP2A family protein phosphatase